MTTLREVALLRVVAQHLVGPRAPTAAQAVRWSTCLQAQDLPGALTSVALRTTARSRQAVLAALETGQLVRSWPVRGTVHLSAAEDLPWLLRLLAPRVVRASAARLAGLGLDRAQLDQARDLALEALGGGRSLGRAGLYQVWQDGGLSPAGQRGVHLLRHLAMTATVVLGPMAGNEQHVVLLQEWIPHLATLDVEGVEHLLDPATPDLLTTSRTQAEGVLLLPGFDELILGHRDRRAQLDPAHADKVTPGGNGVFRPTVIHAGRVVGTWTRTGRGNRSHLAATPFTTFAPEVETSLPQTFAALP